MRVNVSNLIDKQRDGTLFNFLLAVITNSESSLNQLAQDNLEAGRGEYEFDVKLTLNETDVTDQLEAYMNRIMQQIDTAVEERAKELVSNVLHEFASQTTGTLSENLETLLREETE